MTAPRSGSLLAGSSLALALAAAACSNPTPPPPPAAFDRPESLSFYCWDAAAEQVVPLATCAPAELAAGEDDVGSPAEPFELIAVVTQTGTGEVAATQVTGAEEDDTPGVIDSDVRLPGFTFAAVGDVPSAVVTPPGRPEFTYVVSRGSSELHVIESLSFHEAASETDPNQRGARVTPIAGVLPEDSRPSAMVLTPDESALIITLPQTGQIARVPIDGATVGPAELLDLATTIPAPVDLSALPDAERPADYTKECGDPLLVTPAPLPPRTPVSEGTAPMPWALAIDREEDTVLVADRALPIIHVIDLASLTELAPISVGVPTRDLAITPRVPATIADWDPTAPTAERFVYAIDATDHSVLAVDYSFPARGSYGGVLTVTPTGTLDRLAIPVPARAIEVVTPRYSASAPVVQCDDADDSSPVQLHGVFLAVATTDGRVRFFDIFDNDTTCRGTGCFRDADNGDEIVAIRRHRPRIGHFVQEPVALSGAPSWQFAQASGAPVQDTGANGNPDQFPALTSVACPAGLAPVFPVTGAALVCAVTDPFAARPQVVTAAYQGAIPGTVSSGANFDEATASIQVRFDPCELGVLGSADEPGAGSLAGYPGDIVAVTGPLPPSITLNEDEYAYCAPLVGETDSGTTTPLLFRVTRAISQAGTYAGRLELQPLEGQEATLADLARCFPELLQIEVRAADFLVTSSFYGFSHAIERDAVGGQCVVNLERDAALERGRVSFDQPFESSFAAFAIGSRPPGLLNGEAISLVMTVANVPSVLALDPTGDASSDPPSLLSELEYNEIDERLYVVDQATAGLVRVRLTDLATQGRFR
jgi:hypothetical protein